MDRYETLGARFWAGIIDWLVVLPLTAANLAVQFSDSLALPVKSTLVGALGLATVFYSILMNARWGATLGKMAMGVRIVDLGGESPINFNQAVLRSLPQLIPAMYGAVFSTRVAEVEPSVALMGGVMWIALFAFSLGNVLFGVFSEKHRALHDRIARTVVVKTKP